jgi:hypothetical protein
MGLRIILSQNYCSELNTDFKVCIACKWSKSQGVTGSKITKCINNTHAHARTHAHSSLQIWEVAANNLNNQSSGSPPA